MVTVFDTRSIIEKILHLTTKRHWMVVQPPTPPTHPTHPTPPPRPPTPSRFHRWKFLFGLAALKLGYNFTFLEHVLTKIMPVCNVNIFTSVVRRSCSSSHHFFVGSGSTSDQDLSNPAWSRLSRTSSQCWRQHRMQYSLMIPKVKTTILSTQKVVLCQHIFSEFWIDARLQIKWVKKSADCSSANHRWKDLLQ